MFAQNSTLSSFKVPPIISLLRLQSPHKDDEKVNILPDTFIETTGESYGVT
jgi:hypothetical protein